MIKNKIKLTYLLIICAMALFTKNVNAANATGWYIKGSANDVTGLNWSDGTKYNNRDFKVKYKGVTYDSVCIDPGLHLNSDENLGNVKYYTCQIYENGPLNWLLQQKSSYDAVVFEIAVRMLANDIGLATTDSSEYKSPYLLSYSNEDGHKILESARSLKDEALKHNEIEAASLSITKSNTVVKEDTVEITYNLSSPVKITNVEFVCESSTCTKTWNGTSGKLTVTVSKPNCSYAIKVYYNAGGTVYCDGTAVDTQAQVLYMDSEGNDAPVSTNGKPVKTINETINAENGGEYYKKYCDGDKVCNEKTKITIPNYCDVGDNQEITITSPENVVQCILNGKDDAGQKEQPNHSYKMEDGQVESNEYCTVWCKEDYQMYLPGARYANSGSEFKLSDTQVKAQRTCYATGPNKNTKNIDIKKFIDNVVKLQKDIIAKKDEVEKWKALKNGAGTKTEWSKTCNGIAYKGEYYEYDVKYTGYTIVKCDDGSNGTGECEYKTEEKSATYWHGEKEGTCTKNVDGSESWTSGSTQEDKRAENYTNAVEALKILVQNLKNEIDKFEKCYSWKNQMCFDPSVLFKYEENYDVDFGLKDKTDMDKAINEYVKIGYKITTDPKNIDNKYESMTGTVTGEDAMKQILAEHNYIICTDSSCSTEEAKDISTLKEKIYYLRKEVDAEALYNNRQKFQTNYPHGDISKVPPGSEPATEKDYWYLGEIYPIAWKTPTGVYKWSIKFQELGQFNNRVGCSTQTTGRLNEVAEAIGKASVGTDIEYVCLYVVDCCECIPECECGDNKDCVEKWNDEGEKVCVIKVPEPKCPECEVYCIGCIFDGNDTYQIREISLTKVNPNDRDMGANWTTAKGKKTQEEIEKNNESAYIKPEYSFTITPYQMKEIRDYNIKTGRYTDEILSFSNSGCGGNENVCGKSKWLRNLKSDGTLDSMSVNKYFSYANDFNIDNVSWTSWTGITSYGPSWK